MIVSSDPDYLDTKLVKQGFKKLEPIFEELANWIYSKYKTKVLNIYHDKIDKYTPRLNIIFEYSSDEEKFSDERGNFNSEKQKSVLEKCRQILYNDNQEQQGFFSLFLKKSDIGKPRRFGDTKFDIENLLVIFDAFEPIAKEEANSKIPQTEIDNLEKELNAKDVWKIYREFSTATFFFYTNNQIQQYTYDGTIELLKKKYVDLLKEYDEFDYFKTDTKFIKFDSKENFDKTYKGNWFYYYKR